MSFFLFTRRREGEGERRQREVVKDRGSYTCEKELTAELEIRSHQNTCTATPAPPHLHRHTCTATPGSINTSCRIR